MTITLNLHTHIFPYILPSLSYKPAPPAGSKAPKEEEKDVEAYVVQKYIQYPMLIGGKKFDLRLYCLVTSFSPLKVFQYVKSSSFFVSVPHNETSALLLTSANLTNLANNSLSTANDTDTDVVLPDSPTPGTTLTPRVSTTASRTSRMWPFRKMPKITTSARAARWSCNRLKCTS